MVKETRIIVGPEDMKVCGLQCTKCGTEVMPPIETDWPWPESCPMCGMLWRRNRDVETAQQFVHFLRELRQEEESPVRVRLVFNGEDTTSPS